jgi:hypothetical protein
MPGAPWASMAPPSARPGGDRALRHLFLRVSCAAWAILLLASCLSVPVSTIWRLRNFSIEDFAALDPQQLQAAVRTDSRVRIEAIDVVIVVQSQGRTLTEQTLRLQQALQFDPRLEPAAKGRRWFVYGLRQQDAETFSAVRRRILALPRNDGSAVSVRFAPAQSFVPAELERALPIRIDVQFDAREGFFTVLRETAVDVTRGGAIGREAKQ